MAVDDSKGMSENKKAKPRINRSSIGELCLAIGFLLLPFTFVIFDWVISVRLIGAMLVGLGFLLLRLNPRKAEKKKSIFDVLLIAGVFATAACDLWFSWPLFLGGLTLLAAAVSPQIVAGARKLGSYFVKSYREISKG